MGKECLRIALNLCELLESNFMLEEHEMTETKKDSIAVTLLDLMDHDFH